MAGVGAGSDPALASPADTVWVEDVHLHPSGPAELVLVYEYRSEPDDADVGDAHVLTLRTSAGFDRAPMDFQPSVGMSQLGDGPARLDHVGLRARYRLLGTPSAPTALLFAGYRLLAVDGPEHLLEQGGVARWSRGKLAVSGELTVQEKLGGDSQVEVRASAAVTREFLINHVRAGLEAFALVPVQGRRLSDHALGPDGEDVALYLGPSLRMDMESMWLGLGVATGAVLGAGSTVTARAIFATQF